ncbi:DUF4476 domain-containing protein [Chitinophaga vietnamensis]|uniref:DUF4476 domain-containing protein n=1 Tax=Chitinophaga vietnamensis TaxID=2593957 RepID=UPI001177AE1E|nr:DUF4476 domain-containing protein [Chitinophaga vietnamensis]
MHLKYRTVLYVWACLLLCTRVWAQDKHYYVYIQSEKGQPFYVKHNGQVLSSTERGYIVIPKLDAGTNPITVGFPQNQAPEQHFAVRISQKDQGFLLKQGADGYTLYNLQSFREIKADNGDATPAAAPAEQETTTAATEEKPADQDTARKEMMANMQKDIETTFAGKATIGAASKKPAPTGNSFSSALDKVVVSADDRDVVEEVAPAKPAPAATDAADAAVKKPKNKKQKGDREPLTEEEQALLKDVLANENKAAASEAATEEAAKEAVKDAAAPADDVAPKKQKRHKKKEGDPDFIEFQDDKNAPAATAVAPASVPVAAAPETPAPVSTDEQPASVKRKKRHRDDSRSGEIVTDTSGYGLAVYDQPAETRKKKKRKSDDEAAITADATAATPAAGTPSPNDETSVKKNTPRLVNSDCANVMDDGTFRKLLRRFVAAKSDDSMLDVFRRQSRNYCMETAQIKTLAQLMSSDETRYRLLDTAYPITYDSEKYSSLESVLTDSYYKGRFKAMLHK